ncbi:MAG: SpoIIE family protein phosphatase, partial [Bacteroidota bacterium]
DYTLAIRASVTLVLLGALLLLFTGIWSWLRGNNYARFFTVAWIVYLFGLIIYALRNFGIFPDSFWIQQMVRIGSVLEVTLLSFALAERINEYRREKEEAQEKALVKAQENEQVLEERVKQRTVELQEKQNEIITQNEELRQTQEELQAQRDALGKKNQILDRQNRQVSTSIRAAELIQNAILQDNAKTDRFFSESFVINRPRDVVSGDFYFVASLSDNELLLVSADCTGHGVPGAFMTIVGHSFLEQIIQIENIKQPNEILERLHELVYASLRKDRAESDSGMDAAVIYIKRESDVFTLTFSGAKTPIYYAKPEDEKLTVIRGTARSVGWRHHKKRSFDNHTFQLPEGSVFYTGSDGLQDQNNDLNQRFTSPKLREVLASQMHKSFPEQKQHLEATLDEFKKGVEQRDDILWLGARLG